MDNPLTCILLHIVLFIEMTSIYNEFWALAYIHMRLAEFQRNEACIGRSEESTAKSMVDNQTKLNAGAGHMIKLPAYVENAPKSLIEIMKMMRV